MYHIVRTVRYVPHASDLNLILLFYSPLLLFWLQVTTALGLFLFLVCLVDVCEKFTPCSTGLAFYTGP